jgi:hypothetical protein
MVCHIMIFDTNPYMHLTAALDNLQTSKGP